MNQNNVKSPVYVSAISLLLAEATLYTSHLVEYQHDMLFGLGAGILTHVLTFRFFRRSIGLPAEKFLAFVIGGIFLRLFLLILFLFLVLVDAFLQAGPFVIGLLTAYFTGSAFEIAWLVSNKRGTGP